MSNVRKIVSTAFNFGQQFSAGVNKRTGIYQVSFTLGKLYDFELKVGYSHLNMGNEGFGIGWSLNVSRYDRALKRLILSDGRSYRVEMSRFRPDVECQYLKLQDIIVTHQNEVLKVTFKDGTIEQFDSDGNLHSVTAPSGHKMTFIYKYGRLEHISNSANLSLDLQYDQGGVLVLAPDGRHSNSTYVRVSSGRLTDVTLPDNTAFRIEYRAINGLYVVEYLHNPTGAIEKLAYNGTGMSLPSGGPADSLPTVSLHEIYGADVPLMTRTYRYSSYNFMGYGLPRYTPDVDNLFETASNYTYSCTETFGDKEVTQIYNKYHLLIEESVLALPGGQLMQKTVTEYYADTSREFASQPDQYLLPRKQTVTYYNLAGKSRSEVSEFEYDSYGNVLRQLDPYGIQSRFVYYPATGEDGAPAAPTDIPCLLKSQTITPTESKYQGYEEGKISEYRYALFPSLQSGKSYPVRVRETTRLESGRRLSQSSFNYLNDPTKPSAHGALLRSVASEGSLAQSEDYVYWLGGDTLETTVTTTLEYAGANIRYTETQKVSLENGQQLSSKDRLENLATTEYDALGRVTKEAALVGSVFQQTTLYRYAMGGQNQLDVEMSDGTYRRVTYDGLGRELANYATDSAGNLVLMSQQSYNALGQVATRTVYDEFGAGEIGVTTTLSYDVWGEVSEETLASGEVNVTERDKANNTQTQYVTAGSQRSAAVTTYYDELDEVIKVVDVDGETVTTYDGFGAAVTHKNPFNVKTTIVRDAIGRVVREQTGDITINNTYTQDNRELVTKLWVTERAVGERQYDALGRTTSETKEGLTTNYHYDTLDDKPTVATQPNGDRINYTLSLELGEVTGIITSDGVAAFEFNARGQLLKVSNTSTLLQYTYYLDGQLKSESMSGKTATYTYSRQGQLLTLTDYMGHVERRSYDRYHRLQEVVLGETTVTLSYDAFGRLQQDLVTSPTNLPLKHQYIYDAQGRLTDKKTTRNGVLYLSQQYTYVKGMRLESKKVTNVAGNITTERYRYDDHGRVVEVNWSGSERPDYLGVGNMLSQSFTFDSQDNITEVGTLFTRGSGQERDTASYIYDKGRLLRVTHSLPELPGSELTYDDNGNLTRDEQGRHYRYNTLGQLAQIQDAGGTLLSTYTYSANGLQLEQSVPGQPAIELFYGLDHLLNESQGMVNSRILIVGGRPISRLVTAKGVITETGLVTDYKGSVLREVCGQMTSPLVYTHYGEVTGKTPGGKQLVAVVTAWGTPGYAHYFWDDESYSDFNTDTKKFTNHYSDTGNLINAWSWPAGKHLGAVTAYPGNEGSWAIYYWSDGSYSIYDISKRRFYTHYSATDTKVIFGWPAGKVLVAAVPAWAWYPDKYQSYFWSDGSYSNVNVVTRECVQHFDDTSNFNPWGWPVGQKLATVVTAWGRAGYVNYFWRDGSHSEFDTVNCRFVTAYSAIENDEM
ncbi:hypothetical protein RA180_19990 [Aeromonas salmonicida]|uniref:hypothetical protein n=1 Tax=Aeromonas salmonicida TaxID=645 RepID=UPI002796D73B|nr:hypothetical protein [Aeromonas salmonicida]MDQ1886278.1 hypothetical protein [Aeromonas salmonicida]